MPNFICDEEWTDEEAREYSRECERRAQEHWEEVHGLRPRKLDIAPQQKSFRRCTPVQIITDVFNFEEEDKVAVIRCKNCAHRGWIQDPEHGKSIDYCKLHEYCVSKNDYCSHGVKKIK